MKFLFHVFVLLESSGDEAKTPNAFVFFLNNFKGLAPFVSELNTGNAIFRNSKFGPAFGQDLYIFYNAPSDRPKLTLNFGNSYSFPASVTNKLNILALQGKEFLPDEVEVFYLDPSL